MSQQDQSCREQRRENSSPWPRRRRGQVLSYSSPNNHHSDKTLHPEGAAENPETSRREKQTKEQFIDYSFKSNILRCEWKVLFLHLKHFLTRTFLHNVVCCFGFKNKHHWDQTGKCRLTFNRCKTRANCKTWRLCLCWNIINATSLWIKPPDCQLDLSLPLILLLFGNSSVSHLSLCLSPVSLLFPFSSLISFFLFPVGLHFLFSGTFRVLSCSPRTRCSPGVCVKVFRVQGGLRSKVGGSGLSQI